jgi:hypothetical protein
MGNRSQALKTALVTGSAAGVMGALFLLTALT